MYSINLEVEPIVRRWRIIYNRRNTRQAYAIARRWAAETLNYFVSNQRSIVGRGEFWTNRTYRAAEEFFTEAFIERSSVGYRIVNAVPYGIYLELDHGRRFSAIRPLMQRFYPLFLADMQALYGADLR